MPGDSGVHAFFVVFFVALGVIVCGWVFTGYVILRRRNALKAAGFDPLTADVQIAAKLANSDLLAPAESIESRLAELDALRAKGTITAEEYAAARSKALGL